MLDKSQVCLAFTKSNRDSRIKSISQYQIPRARSLFEKSSAKTSVNKKEITKHQASAPATPHTLTLLKLPRVTDFKEIRGICFRQGVTLQKLVNMIARVPEE
jgi:hypothetical protein